ncbi:MAG: YceI family protein [Fluviibacter sp.]|jgi:polyisoprenoid-binding protein YceI
MKKTTLIAATLLSAFATSAFAAPTTYTIDASHTFASFEYTHLGFSKQRSRFNDTTGSITLDQKAKTGSADITIKVDSVDTGSKTFDGHLTSDGWFDAAKYPTISFKSTGFKFKGDKPTEVMGNLTVRDITQPVTLKITHFQCAMHPMKQKEACGANAVTHIKRSEFGLGKYAPNVSDDVELTIAVEAIKE